MKHKWIAIALITVLLCMILPSSMACTEHVCEFDLTVASTEGGTVTAPGEGTFAYTIVVSSGEESDHTVNLVARAADGYRFVKWTGDVDTIANVDDSVTTITLVQEMKDRYSVTANFMAVYDLTISSTAGGSVTTPGVGTFTYDEGTVVNLVATADSGAYFINWTGDVGTIFLVNAPMTPITMNDNYSITANFLVVTYDLTVSSTDGGSVTTPEEGLHQYDEGEVVSLVAEADAGYRFVNWTGDVSAIADVNSATTTIAMNGHYSVAANFVAVYDLTVSSTDGGSVTTPEEGLHQYDEGEVVGLVAEADAGYAFVNWTGDVSAIVDANSATTTITMDGHYSIAANFRWTCELCPK
jgi:hypothetical protein